LLRKHGRTWREGLSYDARVRWASTIVVAACAQGENDYRAGPGGDRIEAANGVREEVRCGPGRDRATVDASDNVTACERRIVRAAR
jgi:hypothetical protein